MTRPLSTTPPRAIPFTFRGAPWVAELRGKRKVVLLQAGRELVTGSWVNGLLTQVAPAPGSEGAVRGISVEASAALRKLAAGDGQQELLATSEAMVRQEVSDAIGALPDVLLLSNPIGTAQFPTERGKYRYVDYGLEVGSPDLVAMMGYRQPLVAALPRSSRIVFEGGIWWLRGAQWLGLELKAPGKAPKEHQEDCHRRWEAHGAWIWPAITSGAQAMAAIEEARALLRATGAEPCEVDRALLAGIRADGGT